MIRSFYTYLNNFPQNKHIVSVLAPLRVYQVAEVEGRVTCQVTHKMKQLHILFTSMVRVCHKLASIDEVYKLNLGQFTFEKGN